MAKILEMPKLSPTMEEGVLLAWHKEEGDNVDVDDLLAEVETDKATMEFRAFDKGTLLKRLVPAGTNVRLGQAVAIVGEAGEEFAALIPSMPASPPAVTAATAATATPATPAMPAAPAADKGSPLDRTQRDGAAEGSLATESGARLLASPYVRKVARERGIDLNAARGTGEHGRIMPADLDGMQAVPSQALARTAQGSISPALSAPELRPLSPMRKTIARRLTESKQSVPHFYLTIDVDARLLVELRETINAQLSEAANKRGDAAMPDKISLNDLIIKAVASALVRVPECNAQFTAEALAIHTRIDIEVAVAIADGLVTPVLRNADQKSVVAIAREVRDLAARARAKKLRPDEMSDGTFSISNLGMFGIDSFSAVINPPAGAILAVGQVRNEPIVHAGAVVAGKRMSLTLSCDHRVIDGAVGAAFLAELRALLEHPMRILTG